MSTIVLKPDTLINNRAVLSTRPLRVLFALPGFHCVNRGAEVALESVARELAQAGHVITVIGAGNERAGERYQFIHAARIGRETFRKWPKMPFLHNETLYEDLSFAPGLLAHFHPADYDITVTCNYPYTNWILRAGWRAKERRPAHIYVTQNADWPCSANGRGLKLFSCDGLVCTNPEYFERNKERWPSVLIPNGVDPAMFEPGIGNRQIFRLPENVPLVLMVSALIPSKRVREGIASVARLAATHLVVAGDGPMRREVEETAAQLMPGRFHLLNLPREEMPKLYRCANVFLHMSMIEASANAYIEGLASGLPIVTHDRGVSRWTLEDHAIYVDTIDEAAVAAGIQTALAQGQQHDPSGSRELVARRFTWKAIAEQYATFFNSIVMQ